MAEGGGCRDERRGSSASEVGTDDGTAKKKKKKKKKNLSRKFKTLLQDSFSWHPATNTQHLSGKKNCTGFPFQNVLSIKSLACVSVL